LDVARASLNHSAPAVDSWPSTSSPPSPSTQSSPLSHDTPHPTSPPTKRFSEPLRASQFRSVVMQGHHPEAIIEKAVKPAGRPGLLFLKQQRNTTYASATKQEREILDGIAFLSIRR